MYILQLIMGGMSSLSQAVRLSDLLALIAIIDTVLITLENIRLRRRNRELLEDNLRLYTEIRKYAQAQRAILEDLHDVLNEEEKK